MVKDIGKPGWSPNTSLPAPTSRPEAADGPSSAAPRAAPSAASPGGAEAPRAPIRGASSVDTQQLPAHFPKLEGKPSVIQEAAWRGAELLAKAYYSPSSGAGAARGDLDSSGVLSFIAAAMKTTPEHVLDATTLKLLAVSFKNLGVSSSRIGTLVESLADAVAARLGYRPPLSARRMEDVHEAIELLRESELEPFFGLMRKDRKEAARRVARLMDRLLGRDLVEAVDADDDEERDQGSEDARDETREETALDGSAPTDEEGAEGAGGVDEHAREHGGSRPSMSVPPLPPQNLGARLAELRAIAPEHVPVTYRAVVDFATTLAEIVGLEGEGES